MAEGLAFCASLRAFLETVPDDAELLAKGRRAEDESMGIAAFAYYRCVVENQRQHLFDEIACVTERIGQSGGVVGLFKRAAREDQFSNGVELVRDALPTMLMIEGRNPLLLLQAALSDGLHARSDEECLELAKDIRIVLAALVERVTDVLADRQELKSSIARLAGRIARTAEVNASRPKTMEQPQTT